LCNISLYFGSIHETQELATDDFWPFPLDTPQEQGFLFGILVSGVLQFVQFNDTRGHLA
jgi:hypothetical protein